MYQPTLRRIISIMTPFTYKVTHKKTNQFYYGVRYAKGCSPSDMWIVYFTSSSTIKKLIELEGKDAFTVEIRKTFKDTKTAINWEKRVTRKIISWSNCLNQASWPAVTPEARSRGIITRSIIQEDGLSISQKMGIAWKQKKNLIDPKTGLTFGEIRKKKFNESLVRNGTRNKSDEFKASVSGKNNPACRPEVGRKISKTMKDRIASGQIIPHATGKKLQYVSDMMTGNQIAKGLIWINNGVKDYRHDPKNPMPEEYKRGRLISNNKGHVYQNRTCPHCNTSGAGGNMTRFHFNNCKMRSDKTRTQFLRDVP